MTSSLLLVEDDPDEARRLAACLAHLGHRTSWVEDGDAALERLSREPFDAMLLDLVVPGLDGMGVLRALAARGDAVPVVVAVTPAGLEGARSAIRAGACDFVVKPAGALRLEVALANALARGRDAAPRRAGTSPASGTPSATAPISAQVIRLADRVAPDPGASRPLAVPAERLDLLDGAGHVRPLDAVEAELIRFACALYGGRLTEVARRLGIGRSTLYRKLAQIEHAGPAAAEAASSPASPAIAAE
ncbi:response regulator [Xanthobacter sp. KR7-225]|uniref:response regulator n=1 Tax=Xanthobacter sp. KR7-225 TaxID=3156613 RepID=UPI0032B5801F